MQLHGLNLGFALALGLLAGLTKLDLSRFARLKKLQLSGFNSVRASQLGWRLILPRSLRVLHMDDVDDSAFVVSPSPCPSVDPTPA